MELGKFQADFLNGFKKTLFAFHHFSKEDRQTTKPPRHDRRHLFYNPKFTETLSAGSCVPVICYFQASLFS